MPLDQELYNQIVEFLIPYVDDKDDRKNLLNEALYNSPVLGMIEKDGVARNFASVLVRTLVNYDDNSSLKKLLLELRTRLSGSKLTEIDDILHKIDPDYRPTPSIQKLNTASISAEKNKQNDTSDSAKRNDSKNGLPITLIGSLLVAAVAASIIGIMIFRPLKPSDLGVETIATSTDEPTATATNEPTATDEPTATPTDEPASVACTPPDNWFEYTVQRGDTMFSIARRASSTVDTVADGNCLDDASNISVGQVLRLPNNIVVNEYVTYWMPTESETDESVIVGCFQTVSPLPTSALQTNDAATNIQNSLSALFSAPPSANNYWDDGDNLVVQNVSIDDNGRAVIIVSGEVALAGVCSDMLMQSQILLSVFAEPEVQTVLITFDGRNFANLVDMSGTRAADAVFTRDDIGYVDE